MGQYYCIANLDKKEWIISYDFGGLGKLMEFAYPKYPDTVLSALAILLANGNNRGGGDLRSENKIIGSWSGNRISIEGDYADPNPEFSEKDNLYRVAHDNPEWINVSIPVFMAMLDDYYGENLGEYILEDNNYRKYRSVPDVLASLAHAHENEKYPLLSKLCEKAFLKMYGEKNQKYYWAINGIKKHQGRKSFLEFWENEMEKYVSKYGWKQELTDKEIERIDKVNNAVYRVMSELLDDVALEWNMEWIGTLSDAVTDVAVQHFRANEKEFYPFIEE